MSEICIQCKFYSELTTFYERYGSHEYPGRSFKWKWITSVFRRSRWAGKRRWNTSSGKRRYSGDGQLRISSRTLCWALVNHHAKRVWNSSPFSTPVFSTSKYMRTLLPSSQMFPAAQSASGSTWDWNCYFRCLLRNFRKTLQLTFDTVVICNHENRMFRLVLTKNWQMFLASCHFMY